MNQPHPKPREQWGTRMGLIMAMAATAVGLGNFLRFPVQCVNNGGGAFMIPYFIAFILLGIPLMWIEWGIGRFGGKYGHGTAPGMFHYLWKHPLAKYVGAIGLAVPFLLLIYYNYIVSWTLAYSVFSFTGKYFTVPNYQGMVDFLGAYQGKTSNGYFPTIGTAFLFFGVTHFCMTWILSKGISKGIELLAKIAMPLICFFGIVLVIKVFLIGTPNPSFPDRNIMNGFGFIWNPDFSILKQSKVWLAATGQIFFTLSVGFGAIQTYASYMKKKDDVVLSGLATASTNEFCEVILGGSIAIPVAVAFFGLTQTQRIAANGAFDLGFFALPLIFQKMAWGPFFGTIWFFLLFLAGITSSVAIAQPLMAFFQEEFKWTRKATALIVGTMTFFFTLPIIFFLKHGFLNELDFWIGTVGIVVFAIIELVLFIWVFGGANAWREIMSGADIKLPKFILPVMKYVTLTYLVVLFGFWMYQDGWALLMMKGIPKEDYPYVWFARFLIVGVSALMVLLVHIAWQKKHVIQQRIPS